MFKVINDSSLRNAEDVDKEYAGSMFVMEMTALLSETGRLLAVSDSPDTHEQLNEFCRHLDMSPGKTYYYGGRYPSETDILLIEEMSKLDSYRAV